MSDELDNLTDRQLDAVFAVEVDAWTKRKTPYFDEPVFFHADGREEFEEHLPPYSVSFDRVEHFLGWAHISRGGSAVSPLGWTVVMPGNVEGVSIVASATRLARAACIALIRAKRRSLKDQKPSRP